MWRVVDQHLHNVPEADRHQARIVVGALLALLACAAGAFVLNVAAEPELATFLGYLPAVAGLGFALVMVRRGHPTLAAHVAVALSFVAVNGAALFTGGLAGGALHVNGVVVAFAALVLPRRSVAVVAGLVIVTLLGFAVGHEQVDQLQVVESDPLAIVIAPILNVLFLAVMVRFVASLYLSNITKLESQGRALDRTLAELERTSVSKEHVDSILGAVRDMILVTDADRVVVDANPAATRQLHLDLPCLVGRSVDDLLQEVPSDGEGPPKTEALRGDGRPLPVRVSRGALHSDALEGRGFVYVLSDVTVEQAAVDAIRRAHADAETANLAKSQFLATMSHELRTPLNAIIGYAELLADELPADTDPAALHDLGRIERAGHDLLVLINGVLDLSKIEAGKMELNLAPVDLSELVQQVLDTVRPGIERKGLQLRSSSHDLPEGPTVIDAQKLRQVLLNLLSNATKFTRHGHVELTVHSELRTGTRWLHFVISDTGIGIESDHLDRIFEPFAQVDEGRTRSYEGTGLGLSICRAFVRMMGGELLVQSTVGVGSTFHLKMPVGKGPGVSSTT